VVKWFWKIMKVTRTASAAFTAEFESEEELRAEHAANLSMGGLRFVTPEVVALNAMLLVTLRGPWGGESFARATVVANLPDGVALAIDGNSDEHFARLMTRPAANPSSEEPPEQEETNARTSGIASERSRKWRNSCWP
jgi:hypothetical protein